LEFLELIVAFACTFCAILFFRDFYGKTLTMLRPSKSLAVRIVFALTPVVSFAAIVFTLLRLASFDVVDNVIYIMFYIAMGLAWLYLSQLFVFRTTSVSWIDDALGMNNPAAAIVSVCALLGSTLIYCGANIGDGPGWWCVVFAGGLGMVTWFFFLWIIALLSETFERITIVRDVPSAIRMGSYLLASALILARASGGDWTSFNMTVVEFGAAWPLLILAPLALAIELFYKILARTHERLAPKHYLVSALVGCGYIAFSVYAVSVLLPSIL